MATYRVCVICDERFFRPQQIGPLTDATCTECLRWIGGEGPASAACMKTQLKRLTDPRFATARSAYEELKRRALAGQA